ncbi:aminoglycoside phosphotransferase family protein [Streptomyces sp. NPDC005485]|uniref:aminoglycoside phosphotransferase family protein n=1 Tax=Streptomyces sp. NPDC005485 TaxID=3155591 RepID=UPI0033AE1BA6
MLPRVDTDTEWDEASSDEAALRPGVEDLCARLGLAGTELTRFPAGSLPVYAVGTEHVLKLFPGAYAQDAVREARVLSHLEDRLPVPTPRVHAAGAYENGWHYVLMSRLAGEDLAVAWPRVPIAVRDRIATESGAALAALHALDPAPLADVVGPPDWGTFLDKQRAGAVEQQRECGLAEVWLEQIPDYLDSAQLPTSTERVLLHTEFMREHLITDPSDGWRLTGLIDFEPAMTGDRAYDFVGVGLYVTKGDPRLLSRFYEAYGRAPYPPQTLLAYTLLHVYSNLARYLKGLPVAPEPRLDVLADTWFATDTSR